MSYLKVILTFIAVCYSGLQFLSSSVEALADPKASISTPTSLRETLSADQQQLIVAAAERIWKEIEPEIEKIEPRLETSSQDQWRKIMSDYNGEVGRPLNLIIAHQLNYDSIATLLQVQALSDNPLWRSRATRLADIYTQAYVVPADGRVSGYQNHSTGLVALAQLTKSPDLVRAALTQVTNAAYVNPVAAARSELKSPFLSRENSLAIIAILNGRALGAGYKFDQKLFDYQVECLKGHLSLWEKALKSPATEIPNWPKTIVAENHGMTGDELDQIQQTYVRPFMVALSARAALRITDFNPKYKPVLIQAAETLQAMQGLWDPGANAFPYTDRSLPADHKLTIMSDGMSIEPTPDLNALIGSAYLRVGTALQDQKLSQFGKSILPSGFSAVASSGSKQLNQALNLFADDLI